MTMEGLMLGWAKVAYALPAPTRLLRCPQRRQVPRQAGAMLRSIGLVEKLYESCWAQEVKT